MLSFLDIRNPSAFSKLVLQLCKGKNTKKMAFEI